MLKVDGSARVRAALAPMQNEARVSAPQTSQVLHGHVVQLLEQNGDWWRVQSADGYTGWINRGYLEAASGEEHTWATSAGVVVHDADGRVRALPVGARFATDAEVLEGESVDAEHLRTQFPSVRAAIPKTALALFDGARYEWGGGTNWGCDCSGLVQTVFALHGCQLPRDAYQQAECGDAVLIAATDGASAFAELAEGDLLFFSDREDKRVTHVGIAMGNARMVHSALGRGGVAVEELASTEDYVVRLRRNFVGARRISFSE